jgi:tetratricopeptide (TPR) repeat protein
MSISAAGGRVSLALGAVLLFLLFARCAGSDRRAEPGQSAGGSAQATAKPGAGADAELAEAIGEAEEVPREVLARLESEAAQRARDADRSRAPVSTPRPEPSSEPVGDPRASLGQAERYGDLAETKALDGRESPKHQEAEKPPEKPPRSHEPDPTSHKGKAGFLARGKDLEDEDDGRLQKPRAPRRAFATIAKRPTNGQILVFNEAGQREAIKPRAVRVVAFVQGPRARTVVDYVFENPYDRRLEGTFRHPLPADASPAGFAMFDGSMRVEGERFLDSVDLLPELPSALIDPSAIEELAPSSVRKASKRRSIDWGRRKDARVVEQKRAREVYEQIVRENIDPGLMEWSGGNSFEARVFPLEPKSTKRVVIAYEQSLVFDGASFRFAYALPEEASIKQREATLFVDVAKGKISEAPNPAKSALLGKWQRFDLLHPSGGAELRCAVEPPSPNVSLRGRDSGGLGGEPIYAEVRPEIAKGKESKTKRALLLIDTSLSGEDDATYARMTKQITALLSRDDTIEEYAVALFDVRARWLHGAGWRANTEEHRTETVRALANVYLEGATSFAALLEELERQRSWAIDPPGKTTAFLFSDGQISWGIDRLDELERRHSSAIADVRWITYRFGESPVNQALFDLLSNRSKGQTVALLSEAEVDAAAVAHRASPVELEYVRVTGAEAADIVVAGDPHLVFPGQTLKVAGRLLPSSGKSAKASIVLGLKGSPAIVLPLGSEAAADELAPRAWADLYAKKLIAFDDERLDRMVVALSQHYHLANARASFLVLDRDEDWKRYAIEKERVDLSNLEALRKKEEAERRDRSLGVALDGVSAEGRRVVEFLERRTDGLAPLLSEQPLVEAPLAGGDGRAEAEGEYRRARAAQKLDDLLYDRIARTRALAGDTGGALRALSCMVELRPEDTEAMRLVGYALLALAQYRPASEIFERVRLRRPFEGEAYLEEALALDSFGRYDLAARNYEIALARTWARHHNEVRIVAAYHYARLVRALLESGAPFSGGEKNLLETRLRMLQQISPDVRADSPIDLQLTTLWSTDDIDIDLWVFEPNGEKCFYAHRTTEGGGRLYWDVTDGLGPELYQAARAQRGRYETLVHYYGGRAPRMTAPTAMLMVIDKNLFGPSSAGSRRFQMRLLPKRDAVLMMRTDVF